MLGTNFRRTPVSCLRLRNDLRRFERMALSRTGFILLISALIACYGFERIFYPSSIPGCRPTRCFLPSDLLSDAEAVFYLVPGCSCVSCSSDQDMPG